MELQNAVKALAARIAELEKKPVLTGDAIMVLVRQMLDVHLLASNSSTPPAKEDLEVWKEPARGLCPKCKVKPNYFFHVRTCKGPA